MLSMDDAMSILLAKVCAGCGRELPGPGQPCRSCGSVPPVTAPELKETLSGPGALARVEADRLRAAAMERQRQAGDLLAQADKVEHVAVLTQRAEDAQAAVASAGTAAETAAAALRDACEAEQREAGELAKAQAAFTRAERTDEAARRMREGPEREIDTAQRLAAARGVLGRYQDAHGQAADAVTRAQQGLRDAQAAVTTAEAERDQAVSALDNPRVPVSRDRIIHDLIRLVLSGDLTPVEQAMAKAIVSMLATLTGAEQDIRLEAAKTAREAEREERMRTPLMVPTGPGEATVVQPWQQPRISR